MKADFGGNWMKTHQKVFKLVSVFMHYPEKEWMDMLPEIKQEVETIEQLPAKMYIQSFIHYLESHSFEDLCKIYVNTFDFHGVTTLNLTYNVFKDSRDRGAALVKLRQIFSDSDVETETNELPDYVPMILEFLAVADEKYTIRLLQLHYNSFKQLDKDLVKNDSSYHFLIKAALEVAHDVLQDAKVS